MYTNFGLLISIFVKTVTIFVTYYGSHCYTHFQVPVHTITIDNSNLVHCMLFFIHTNRFLFQEDKLSKRGID